MPLQIDLFSSRRRVQESEKRGGYVISRDFTLDPTVDFNKIKEMTNCTRPDVVDAYIKNLKKTIDSGRNYEDIGFGLYADNLYDAEALGLGLYAKKYQIILSFEDKLDFFLHIVSKCNVEAVHKIPHYNDVSSILLGLKQNKVHSDVTFDALFGIDDNIDKYFLNTRKMLKESGQYFGEELIDQLAFEIVKPMLLEMRGIQNYLIAYLGSARSTLGEVVCRSRDYCSLILTSDHPIMDDIELIYKPFGSFIVKPRCYQKYEYAAKEVLVCDNCRRC